MRKPSSKRPVGAGAPTAADGIPVGGNVPLATTPDTPTAFGGKRAPESRAIRQMKKQARQARAAARRANPTKFRGG